MPSFSTAQLAAIESGAYYACDLIEMDFTAAILSDLGISSPLHLCTAYTDLELKSRLSEIRMTTLPDAYPLTVAR